MSYNLMMDNKSIYCVSGSTRHIFNLVSNELEGGKKGSKYPYFQKLSQGGGRVRWNQMKKLLDDINNVEKDLICVPFPIATYFKDNLEIGYREALRGGRSIKYSNQTDYGIDNKGLFKLDRQKSELEGRVHFKEVRKGHPDFENFIFSELPKNLVSRIVHQHKGSALVWEDVLNTFKRFASDAKLKRRDLVVR